jgi:hypothetical protein
MSIRTVSERIKQQNDLLIEMAANEDANSTLMRQSLDEMKSVLIGIQKVLGGPDTEEDTEESRRRLQDKDKDDPKKRGFLGGLFKSGDDKKNGKGLLGGIFSKALGFLVKSLPLIGLAGIFFSDVVSGLFAAALGDYDAGALAQRMLSGGLLGSFFGIKGALIGAVLGAILTPEAKEQLGILKDWLVENEVLPKMLSWFSEQLTDALIGLNALTQGDFGGFISGLDNLVVVVGALGLAFAPFKTVGLILGVVKGVGTFLASLFTLPALFGRISASIAAMYATARMGGRLGPGGMGPPLPAAAGGRMGGILRGAGSLLSRGVRGVGGALVTGAMMAPGLVTSAARTAGSAIASGASAAGSAVRSGVSTAAPVARGAAGGIARSLSGPAAKTAIKKVPVIGALAALGFGASRLFKGDPVGAGLEIASGVASIVPGLGTAASLGIDAAIIARDMSKNKTQELSSAVDNKSESLNSATRERDELVAKTSSNVIMDNSTTNNVSSGGGSSISMSGPISWHDNHDPYSGHA